MSEQKLQETEIGLIPEDWKVLNILKSSLLKARIGWQGLTTEEYLKTGDYFLIGGTDFKKGRIDWENCFYVEKERYDQDKYIQLQNNDILVTKDGTIGKIAFVENIKIPSTLNSGVFVIRPLNESYNSKYLFYIFSSDYFDKFLNKLKAGSTISHLYQKDFSIFDFAIPKDPKEQEAIAKALTDIDNLIEQLDKLIFKKKNIKQGVMQELLTGEKRIKGFEGEWKQKTILDISSELVRGPFGGALKKECFVKNGYKVYEQRNAIYARVDIGNYYINQVKFNELKRFEVNEGDFIISCSGTIGRIFQIPPNFEKGVINQALLKIKINSKEYSEKYFLYYFQWDKFQDKIIESVQGGAMKNLIGMPDFKLTALSLPPTKEEQEAIAKILSDMDLEIEELEQKKDKYQKLKIGMMQELLTGRIRLI